MSWPVPRVGWEAKGRCVRHRHLAQPRAGKVMFRGEETIFQIDIIGKIGVSEKGRETLSRTTAVMGTQ